MRLLELHLKAFGPFTDRRLDLSNPDLHVIFGPNEAGKSSALRALKVLLFGFHPRSTDNFLHSHEQLRVGGRLLLANGSEISFVRRKGVKSTLLSPDDESPLGDGLLDRCLQGMEEKLFSTLFGIDHEALVAGGRELLEQHGQIGQALFSAGLGSRNLRRALDSLEKEAEELYVARGSKRRINQAVSDYREVKRELAAASLSGREFENDCRELERLRGVAEALRAEIVGLELESHRLQRLRRALPLLAERRHLRARLAEMEGAAVLPEDFPDRRRAAQEALRKAREDRGRAATERTGLTEEIAGLTVATPVLAQADSIERLHADVGLYTKNASDLSRRRLELDEQQAQALELLEEIRPGMTLEEAESLRPALGHWIRIQELGNQRQALVQARLAAGEAERSLATAQETLAGLSAPRDPAPLRHQARIARRAGPLDNQRAEAAATVRTESEQLRLDIGRLGLWSGPPEELEALPVPPAETLERFGRDFDALAERRRGLEERRRTVQESLAEAARQLEEMQRAGAVPTEKDLLEARSRRDQAWSLLKQKWTQSGEEAYERTIGEADDLADRLRREADRVQLQAQLSANRDQLADEAEALDADLARTMEETARVETAWKELWQPCGIAPLPPREMHPSWTSRCEKLRDRAAALRQHRRRLEGLEEAVRQQRADLAAVLGELGEPVPRQKGLEPVLARSEEAVHRLEGEERQRTRLEEELRSASSRAAKARQEEETALAELETWKQSWSGTIRGLGLGGDALPSEVSQLVDRLNKIFERRRKADELNRRVVGLERDLEAFRSAVRALAADLAVDRNELHPDQTADHLHALLKEARRQDDKRQLLERGIEKLDREILNTEALRRSMEERLAALRAEAGCDDDAGLEEAERRSAEVRDLRRELDRCERQLLREGAALEDLQREAEAVDADALPGLIEQLGRDVEEKKVRMDNLHEELGRRDLELERGAGGDAAARAAERAQEILARLREDVESHVRLRLAGTLLRREIERYRVENQAPLLRRAAELFATLTLGSFTGLQTDLDDGDEPVLVGIGEGKRVRVEGMSKGTRDQLYLALRLATLEKYLDHAAEPLPFVVDDILVHFDDPRTRAALNVLAELSKKTQVILFTHHERLKEMGEAMRNGAGVFVRELG